MTQVCYRKRFLKVDSVIHIYFFTGFCFNNIWNISNFSLICHVRFLMFMLNNKIVIKSGCCLSELSLVTNDANSRNQHYFSDTACTFPVGKEVAF